MIFPHAFINLITLFQASTTSAATNTSPTLNHIITAMVSNPYMAASIIIQLVLGIALGYVSVKVLKYVLAFIGILVLGAFLNVWSLGGSLQTALQNYYQQFQQIEPALKKMMATLGLLTVGPVSIGFIIGIIIGVVKK